MSSSINIDSNVGSSTHEHTKTLIKECALIHELDHPNIISLVGICLDAGPSPYIILRLHGKWKSPFIFQEQRLVSMHYVKLI